MLNPNSEIIYIEWQDATHSMSQYPISELGELSKLAEIGFLIKETEESIVIGTESQDDATEVRMWLTIPKVNITEIRRNKVGKAFPDKPKSRKTKAKPAPIEPAEIV